VSNIEAWSKCFPRHQLGDALGVRMTNILYIDEQTEDKLFPG